MRKTGRRACACGAGSSPDTCPEATAPVGQTPKVTHCRHRVSVCPRMGPQRRLCAPLCLLCCCACGAPDAAARAFVQETRRGRSSCLGPQTVTGESKWRNSTMNSFPGRERKGGRRYRRVRRKAEPVPLILLNSGGADGSSVGAKNLDQPLLKGEDAGVILLWRCPKGPPSPKLSCTASAAL